MKTITVTRDMIYMVLGMLLLLAISASAQETVTAELTQTIRGTLIDTDTKEPLIGASVIIVNSSSTLGTITDVEGNYRITKVPAERVTVELNYMEYETRSIPNVEVNSGKEVVLNLSMQESLIKMEEVVITAAKNIVDPVNNEYWDYENAYEHDIEDIYQISVSASYKWDKPKTTHELFFNLDNITGNKGRLSEYYDPDAVGKVGYTTQFGLLPNLMYKVYF